MTPAASRKPSHQRSEIAEFRKNGYVVLRDVLDAAGCAEIFGQVVESFSSATWSYVHESRYRAHCPVSLTPIVAQLLRTCARRSGAILEDCLEHGRKLVELSSLTVFPHATAQPVHADQTRTDRHIVTIFVNPMPTVSRVGALAVIPGSHRRPPGAKTPTKILELSHGCAVVMNSRLYHHGTENCSIDRIRPIVYFSFGDDDIVGPAYSIRPEYKGAYDLGTFYNRMPDATCRPRLATGRWAAQLLDGRPSARRILLMNGTTVEHVVEIGPRDRWLLSLLKLRREAHCLSVAEIAGRERRSIQSITDRLVEFGDMGLLTW
jgi:hypothetical protein